MEYNIIKLHKRRFERLHKAIPVRFKIADKLSTDKQKECTAIANNISEGGFSVEVTELEKGLFNIGSRQYVMNASINLPGYSNEIKTVVKPVWDKKSSFTKKHMIGLKFIEMVDINKRCLSSYIANELKMQELYSIPKGRRIKEIGIAKQTPLLSGFLELVKAVILVGLPSLIKMKKAKKLADEMQKGFFATKAISALLNIGFFDEFSANKSVNLSMFAKKKNVDRRLLRLLCDYLCSIKIFKNHASEYSLTSKGLLVKEVMKGVFDIT